MADRLHRKGAYRKGAPLLFMGLWVLCVGVAWAAPRCPVDRIDEQVVVAHVYDGDTVRLADGRKLRFIGINTPERAREERPAEPLADEATRAVERMLQHHGYRLGLRHDREGHDRYGRLLAHPYLPDGHSLNVGLLQRGLAAALVVPPNEWNQKCYFDVERAARRDGEGIWGQEHFRPLASRDVGRDVRGFRFVSGRVVRIGRSRKSLWLNLEGNVALRIPRSNLERFSEYAPDSLKGRRVVARGWVNYHKGQSVITLRHPASLEILK